MEIIVFNAETMPSGRQKKQPQPTLTIALAGAKLRFNPQAVELMGMKVGQRYALGHEKGKPRDWYVFLNEKSGYALTEATGGAMCISNKNLVAHIRECLQIKHPAAATIPIAKEPGLNVPTNSKLWVLITSGIKQGQ